MNHIASPDNSDRGIEAQIQAKGLTAPRITPADLQANIVSEHYFTASEGLMASIELTGSTPGWPTDDISKLIPAPLDLLTFCILVLKNGFTVVGKSAVASRENFDSQIGRNVARADAINQMWPLMGYELKERLYQDALVIGAIPLQALPDTEDFPLGKACDRFDPTCESCQ